MGGLKCSPLRQETQKLSVHSHCYFDSGSFASARGNNCFAFKSVAGFLSPVLCLSASLSTSGSVYALCACHAVQLPHPSWCIGLMLEVATYLFGILLLAAACRDWYDTQPAGRRLLPPACLGGSPPSPSPLAHPIYPLELPAHGKQHLPAVAWCRPMQTFYSRFLCPASCPGLRWLHGMRHRTCRRVSQWSCVCQVTLGVSSERQITGKNVPPQL
jgi:hypothetical protein